jgi:hypothetical protein
MAMPGNKFEARNWGPAPSAGCPSHKARINLKSLAQTRHAGAEFYDFHFQSIMAVTLYFGKSRQGGPKYKSEYSNDQNKKQLI